MARKMLSVRVSGPGHDRIDDVVEQTGSEKSEVVRTILSVAMADARIMRIVTQKLKEDTL